MLPQHTSLMNILRLIVSCVPFNYRREPKDRKIGFQQLPFDVSLAALLARTALCVQKDATQLTLRYSLSVNAVNSTVLPIALYLHDTSSAWNVISVASLVTSTMR